MNIDETMYKLAIQERNYERALNERLKEIAGRDLFTIADLQQQKKSLKEERDAWKARSERRVADLREAVERYEKQLASLKEQNAMLAVQGQEAQSKIDWLMLEYCPEEMTDAQVANWAKHQQAVQVCPECDMAGCRHIRAAISAQEEKA
jgi:seryl-tRNA synthetase